MIDKLLLLLMGVITGAVTFLTSWFSWKKISELLEWFKDTVIEMVGFVFDKGERLYFMFMVLSILYFVIKIIGVMTRGKRRKPWVNNKLSLIKRMLLYTLMLFGALGLYGLDVDVTGKSSPKEYVNKVFNRSVGKINSIMDEDGYTKLKIFYGLEDEDVKVLETQVESIKKDMIKVFPNVYDDLLSKYKEISLDVKKDSLLRGYLYGKYVKRFDIETLLLYYSEIVRKRLYLKKGEYSSFGMMINKEAVNKKNKRKKELIAEKGMYKYLIHAKINGNKDMPSMVNMVFFDMKEGFFEDKEVLKICEVTSLQRWMYGWKTIQGVK